MKVPRLISLILCVLSISGTALAGSGAAPSLSLSSADTVTPLVELYTSEGCSSCPSADEYLTSLGSLIDDEFHAVPLAFHVDYWNWLGWEDPFSQEIFTERQRTIAEYNHQRSIYTPELVVTGREARGGKGIVQHIQTSNQQPAKVSIDISLTVAGNNGIEADIVIDNMDSGTDAEAYIALYENDIVRDIKGGENNGRTITYNFVVRHWSEPFEVESGISKKMLSLALGQDWNNKNLGFAVVVVDSENGETLQALRTPLEPLFSG
jgi:hypothetical protein